MKNKTLDERELNFINRIEEIGKFEYIGGYETIKGNVKVKHLKCGCEVIMRAYAVAYSDVDKCRECGRQVRDFEKCKKQIEKLNPDITVIDREKDAFGKNRYYVMCNECGDTLLISYDVLKEGNFKCCLEGVRAYERVSKYKARELFIELKNNHLILNEEELLEFIKGRVCDDIYLRTYKGLYDTEKLCNAIKDYIEARYKKEKIKVCTHCGEYKTGTVNWGRKDINYNSGICIECAKKPKKCNICGKEKKINSFPSDDNGIYKDICFRCNSKNK